MKKAFLPVLLATAVFFSLQCCIGCTPSDSEEEEEDEVQEPERPHLDPGTYQFVVSPLKGSWEEGDKIFVHGSYGPKATTITLSKGDISADGKTASVELSQDVTDYYADPDGLYAAWPAQAVKEEDALMSSATTFEEFLIPLAVAFQKDKRFEFVDATAGLRFKVTDGADEYAIACTRRQGMRLSSYYADYTSLDPSFIKPKDDGYPFRYGKLENGEATLWFPGGASFKGGYSIFIKKDGVWSRVYSVKEDAEFKVGEIKDLGDITSALTAYEGPEPKMPEMGAMTKYTVNFNEFSGLCLSEDKSFLWTIDDNGKLGRIDITNNIGEVLESWSAGGDPEGITMNPETGDLIVGNEEPVSVGVIKAPVKKSDKQTIIFKIKEASGYGNSGLEGITYYKKDGDRDLIYCGTQVDANLFLCDLNAAVDGSKYTTLVQDPISLRKRFPGVLEIAGLSYDPLTGWLWMIDSEAHKIFVFSGDASELLCAYALKSKSNEEGIVVDHSRNCVWVADDYGSPSYLYKYEFPDLKDYVLGQ